MKEEIILRDKMIEYILDIKKHWFLKLHNGDCTISWKISFSSSHWFAILVAAVSFFLFLHE